MDYIFDDIENKWQKHWNENKTFVAKNDSDKEKFYVLEMFPYPSGKIHMGHVSNYTIGDCISRFYTLNGYEVLHPIGWDSFGMPAENAAIENKIPPSKWTIENIETMKSQLKKLGFSYDWEREVATCKEDYYKWGQWFILKMYEKGLLYRKSANVNWCNSCQTVLANEQVDMNNRCWRCDSEVDVKKLDQWYIKITDYAEELLQGHEEIKNGWPENVLTMQKNWIGKSHGASINFKLDDGTNFPIFTTRADTIHGVTYMAIAFDHEKLLNMTIESQMNEMLAFIEKAKKINQREDYEKEGVFTGRYVTNPFNGEKVPLYAANFVLAGYGSGAVMAVPAHDQRDFEFAKKYNIPMKIVIQNAKNNLDTNSMNEAYTADGVLINSGEFDGMKNREAINKIMSHANEKGFGKKTVQYKLRDWLISRQRYWGNPMPFVYCDKCGIVPVPESQLPVLLPTDVEISLGGNPLAKIDDFVNTTCPKCGEAAKRETDTMDTFTCSSWYFARYTDAHNDKTPFSADIAKKWLSVDQYVGGIEHACMHLLYARFWHKFMRDLGLVDTNEPFTKLLTQGMVLAHSYFDAGNKKYYTKEEYENEVYKKDSLTKEQITVKLDKMSKSKKNGVDPDELIKYFGADAVRVFIMFASPPEMDVDWNEDSVKGAQKFLHRIWRLFDSCIENDLFKNADCSKLNYEKLSAEAKALYRFYHKTIKRVTVDIKERYHFNTAIAALMELLNQLSSFKPNDENDYTALKEIMSGYLVLLNPIAPHITEELYSIMNADSKSSIIESGWVSYNDKYLQEDNFELVLQVNGKLRDRLQANINITEDEAKNIALNNDKVQPFTKDKEIVRVVYVKQKLVNIVVK